MTNDNIIILSKREDPFVRIPKQVLANPDLSWQAKGILSYLIGKPSGWKTQVADIVKHGKDGESAVRSALKELRIAGYAELLKERDEHGRVKSWIWKISDSPIFDYPLGGFRDVDNPQVENHHLIKNEGNKNDGNKNESKETNFLTKDSLVVQKTISKEKTSKPEKNAQKQKLNREDADTKTSKQVLAPPRGLRTRRTAPTEEAFNETVVSLGLMAIADHRPNLWHELNASGWKDGAGKPILNWAAFIMGLNDAISRVIH